MISMTGFGYAEREDERFHASVELKSYNNRYLDIQVNLPPFLSPLEPRLREYLGATCRRGRIEIYVRLRELEENLSVHLDRGVAGEYATILRELAGLTGIDEPLQLRDLLQMEGILKSSRSRDIEQYWEALQPLLQEASAEFSASREREGRETAQDILKNIDQIETGLTAVTSCEGELERYFTETIRQRFMEIAGDDVDESRILAEIAALLVKYSINEELVRMRGHLNSFRSITRSDETVGKKLDFLAQEIHREINTIGSKSVQYDISSSVVEMKDALEKIREQLRNVE